MRAFYLTATNDDVTFDVRDQLSDAQGDVLIDVIASSINYKDWLVSQPGSRVRRTPQLIMGVEGAGRVLHSESDLFGVGDEVIAYGGTIGVGRDGGFAESLRVPARYVTKLPSSFVFHARQAMIFGLAGYTAMASVLALEKHGVVPGEGKLLVTGATGGVGSLAVTLAARRGHTVVASTGSSEHTDWLMQLGAADVVPRSAVTDKPDRVLASELWSGAIDCVGGETLASILRSLSYGGAVAASGLVAGAQLDTTVYPFITRNVALIGIDSVESSPAQRTNVWKEIALASKESDESLVEREVSLEEIPEGLSAIGRGATRGRWLVRPTN